MRRMSFNEEWFVTKLGERAALPVGPVTVPYDAMLFEGHDPATPNSHHTGFHPGGVYRRNGFGVGSEERY